MKIVTIPTCANPFVVIVNGIKYTYPAGATVEVPDDVAEVIEQHEEAKSEPVPVLPPFATGAVDDEVVDFSTKFNFVTSIAAGGAKQTLEADCGNTVERLQKGSVKVRVRLADMIVEQYVNALIIDDHIVAIFALAESSGVLLYLHMLLNSNTNIIIYSCQQLLTQPVNFS